MVIILPFIEMILESNVGKFSNHRWKKNIKIQIVSWKEKQIIKSSVKKNQKLLSHGSWMLREATHK